MEKLVYLLTSDVAPATLQATLADSIAPEILFGGDVHELELYVNNHAGLAAGDNTVYIDPGRSVAACISLWLPSLDSRHSIESLLKTVSTGLAAYSVTESVPREYSERHWLDGTPSPGVTLFAAFGVKPGLDDDSFFFRWHESHTPLSLRIHPLVRYVRNTVSRVLTPGAPPYRGLVFETVASQEQLVNAEKFYGSAEHRQQAIDDLCSFVDLGSMVTVPMSEIIMRAAGWRR